MLVGEPQGRGKKVQEEEGGRGGSWKRRKPEVEGRGIGTRERPLGRETGRNLTPSLYKRAGVMTCSISHHGAQSQTLMPARSLYALEKAGFWYI